jgi:hypothetical protein
VLEHDAPNSTYWEDTFMRTTIRSRAVWLFTILVLVAALALSACGAHNGGGNNGGYSGGQTTQTQATPDIQDLENADQSLQDISRSLQGISNDANTDYSGQDTPQQP